MWPPRGDNDLSRAIKWVLVVIPEELDDFEADFFQQQLHLVTKSVARADGDSVFMNQSALSVVFLDTQFRVLDLESGVIPDKTILADSMIPIGQIELSAHRKRLIRLFCQKFVDGRVEVDDERPAGSEMLESAPQTRQLVLLIVQVHEGPKGDEDQGEILAWQIVIRHAGMNQSHSLGHLPVLGLLFAHRQHVFG